MLPTGAAEMDERVEGVPLIVSKTDISLNRWLLPLTPNDTVDETWYGLSQSKPIICIGYVARSDAAAALCHALSPRRMKAPLITTALPSTCTSPSSQLLAFPSRYLLLLLRL
jgi:hypothetical protein